VDIRSWFRFKAPEKSNEVHGEAEVAGVSPKREKGQAAVQQPASGAFVDEATFHSFAGTTTVASIISALVERLVHVSSDWIPALAGFLIGLAVLYLNVSDEKAPPQKVGRAVVIGVVNALLIASSVLGVYHVGQNLGK
jgi:hypothetical protein